MKNKPLLRSLLGGALLAILAIPVVAQPNGRGPRGDGPRGDGPPPDGMRHGPERGPRPKGELNRIWHDIADLEGSKLALSRAQSAKVVALVLPVSRQQTLSDSAAKTLADKIDAVLTSAQKAEFDRDRPRGGYGGGRGDGPPPGEGQGGPPPGGRGPREGERPDGPPPGGRGPRDGGPRDGGPRDGGPRDGGPRDGGPRDGGPRDGDPRDGGPRDGDPRDGGPRDGGPRDGGPRDGGPRDGGPRDGGPPRMNREDFKKARPFMDALNPFYAPTGYAGFKALPTEFAKDVVKRYGERRALLETLSKRAKDR